ncbi:MAG TPA: ABC transporter substrate-binding protein [Caldimonas sp.]|nr:ABC transporter substrate-binding protein [Caldimonas sp.]
MTTIDRRDAIRAAACFLASAPLLVRAQSRKPARVGFIGNSNPVSGASQLDALRRGLRDLGWNEGANLNIELRWSEGRSERLPALVDDLVRSKVDVIVVSGPSAIAAARKATDTIPVVFVLLVDPVAMGFVKSLARPGGNMTGLASQYEELITKQLQLLKEALPGLSRVALLRHAEAATSLLDAAQSAARSLGLVTRTFTVSGEAEFEKAFSAARSERVGAVQVLPSPYLGAVRMRLIELAARYRLPAFYELSLYVRDGGLMSYGPSIDDLYGRSASYVDRILNGARPGELAVERPARFELVINRRTASALGLTLPATLLARADSVID